MSYERPTLFCSRFVINNIALSPKVWGAHAFRVLATPKAFASRELLFRVHLARRVRYLKILLHSRELPAMARLHEYQGKAILAANGFKIPRGRPAFNADEAMAIAREFESEVVIKIQAWTTGRAGIGGVAFARKPADVRGHAARMLAMKVGQFPVEAVLVEEKIAIEREFFLSFAINDGARAPMIIFAAGGGSGIEERAASTKRIACDVKSGPVDTALNEAVSSCRTFQRALGATGGIDSEII